MTSHKSLIAFQKCDGHIYIYIYTCNTYCHLATICDPKSHAKALSNQLTNYLIKILHHRSNTQTHTHTKSAHTTQICTHTHAHNTCMPAHACPHTHACKYTCTHTRTHTHTHTHTHRLPLACARLLMTLVMPPLIWFTQLPACRVTLMTRHPSGILLTMPSSSQRRWEATLKEYLFVDYAVVRGTQLFIDTQLFEVRIAQLWLSIACNGSKGSDRICCNTFMSYLAPCLSRCRTLCQQSRPVPWARRPATKP